jgi:hypothetical protein
MNRVIAPNKHFRDTRFGVRFLDGVSEPVSLTNRQYEWFAASGYKIEGDRPEDTPSEESQPATPKADKQAPKQPATPKE